MKMKSGHNTGRATTATHDTTTQLHSRDQAKRRKKRQTSSSSSSSSSSTSSSDDDSSRGKNATLPAHTAAAVKLESKSKPYPSLGAPQGIIDLCDSEEESKQPLSIDLCDSDDDNQDDQDDDAALARQLQRKFDSEAASAAPVDFRALDAARRERAAARPRAPVDDDLLLAQRRSLRDSAARSAAQLKLRVVRVAHNEHSKPGRPLYQRFVQAWRRVPDKRLRLVYHATPERNIPSILRQGLDSRRRGSQHGQVGGVGEYFGKDVATSAPYGQGSRKMIVFAILIDRSGITSEGVAHKGEIVVNKKDHQLPLAVVVFHKQPVATLQPGSMMLPGMGGMLNGLNGRGVMPGVAAFSGQGKKLGGKRSGGNKRKSGGSSSSSSSSSNSSTCSSIWDELL